MDCITGSDRGLDLIAKVAKTSNRGSKPGEHRGGRVKGTPNKATSELKDLAREYTAQALETLVGVMTGSESDAARVSAAKEVLDRGYGKASQVISGNEDGGPVEITTRIELIGIAPRGDSPA
jgi:hypothetical protein